MREGGARGGELPERLPCFSGHCRISGHTGMGPSSRSKGLQPCRLPCKRAAASGCSGSAGGRSGALSRCLMAGRVAIEPPKAQSDPLQAAEPWDMGAACTAAGLLRPPAPPRPSFSLQA